MKRISFQVKNEKESGMKNLKRVKEPRISNEEQNAPLF